MAKFCSIVENDQYKIGCTGQTVWVWDKNDILLAKFKDLIYAYKAAISPLADIFVVKDAMGRLAVYSLKTLSLIKKFRYSKVNYSQDDGFCFSGDGKFFLNIERQGDDLHTAISVYNVSDFSLVSRIFQGENMAISHIQAIAGEYFILGFTRSDDLVCSSNFVAKYRNDEICDFMTITNAEYEFYWKHIYQTAFGLWLGDGEKINTVHTLSRLWDFYNQKPESLKLQ